MFRYLRTAKDKGKWNQFNQVNTVTVMCLFNSLGYFVSHINPYRIHLTLICVYVLKNSADPRMKSVAIYTPNTHRI
jgi:hypothetical protein